MFNIKFPGDAIEDASAPCQDRACLKESRINEQMHLSLAQSTLESSSPRFANMADGPQYPHHDTLAPPRKSVELEDPGAHELCETFPSFPVHAVGLLTTVLISGPSFW